MTEKVSPAGTATHIPDGLMCCGCAHAARDCSSLPFESMRVIGAYKDDGVKRVRCTDYKKAK